MLEAEGFVLESVHMSHMRMGC
jgi:hypothetical protein